MVFSQPMEIKLHRGGSSVQAGKHRLTGLVNISTFYSSRISRRARWSCMTTTVMVEKLQFSEQLNQYEATEREICDTVKNGNICFPNPIFTFEWGK